MSEDLSKYAQELGNLQGEMKGVQSTLGALDQRIGELQTDVRIIRTYVDETRGSSKSTLRAVTLVSGLVGLITWAATWFGVLPK